MGFIYNPLTGEFNITGASGGGSSSGAFNPKFVNYSDDGINESIWFTDAQGGASVSHGTGNSQIPGVIEGFLGTDGTGTLAVLLGSPNNLGELPPMSGATAISTRVLLANLATDDDIFILEIGLLDWEGNNGLFIRYDRSLSTNWYIVSSISSVETAVETDISVAADVVTFDVAVNSDLNSVEYFINGVSAGTITDNIPTERGMGVGFIAAQSAYVAVNPFFILDYSSFSSAAPFR